MEQENVNKEKDFSAWIKARKKRAMEMNEILEIERMNLMAQVEMQQLEAVRQGKVDYGTLFGSRNQPDVQEIEKKIEQRWAEREKMRDKAFNEGWQRAMEVLPEDEPEPTDEESKLDQIGNFFTNAAAAGLQNAVGKKNDEQPSSGTPQPIKHTDRKPESNPQPISSDKGDFGH